MPKVNSDYFEEKKNKILDAAFTVCMKKPMHEVSMRDIISESGLSQGGIYRYFSNLTDILVALITRDSECYDVKTLVDTAISSDKVPEKVIGEIFGIYEKTILDNLVGVGKIYYEANVLYANDKESLSRFSQTRMVSEEAYLQEKCFSFIAGKIVEGYFKPKLPLEDLFNFLAVSFDGIIRDLILSKHYQFPIPAGFEKDRLIKSLCTALVLLLDGNEKLIE